MTYSQNPFESIREMTDAFGMRIAPPNDVILGYRMDLLREEMKETEEAVEGKDAEMTVDGHMDLVVISLGTLAIMRVDIDKAFNEVMEANMRKVSGPRADTDPTGMSITKPMGWRPPSHSDNHGELNAIYKR